MNRGKMKHLSIFNIDLKSDEFEFDRIEEIDVSTGLKIVIVDSIDFTRE